EWDALSDAVKTKLQSDLVTSIETRLKAEGNLKVASERPFNDQRQIEDEFLLWKPPILRRAAGSDDDSDDNRPLDLHLTPSPPSSPPCVPSPPPAVIPRLADALVPATPVAPPTAVTQEPAVGAEESSEASEDPFVPLTDMPKRQLPWKTHAVAKIDGVGNE